MTHIKKAEARIARRWCNARKIAFTASSVCWTFTLGGKRAQWWPTLDAMRFGERWARGLHAPDFQTAIAHLAERWKLPIEWFVERDEPGHKPARSAAGEIRLFPNRETARRFADRNFVGGRNRVRIRLHVDALSTRRATRKGGGK